MFFQMGVPYLMNQIFKYLLIYTEDLRQFYTGTQENYSSASAKLP